MNTKFLIVAVFTAWACLQAAASEVKIETPTSNLQPVVLKDQEDQDIDDYVVLSPAERYYKEKGRSHPVEDVIDSDDYQATVDSCNVVLELFPGDYLSRITRSFAGYKLGNDQQSISDALEVICEAEQNEDYLPLDILDYYIFKDPATVKRLLQPYTADYLAGEWVPGYEVMCVNQYRMLMAQCERNLNNPKEAYRIAKIAFDATGYYEDALLLMSTLLMRNGTPEPALKLMETYVDDKSFDSTPFLMNYILTLRDSGQSKKAGKILKKLIKKTNFIYDKLYYKKEYAVLLAANKDYKKAIKLLDEIIDEYVGPQQPLSEIIVDANFAEALLRRGIYKINLGNVDKGKEDMKALLQAGEDNDYRTGFEVMALAYLGEKEKVSGEIEDSTDEIYKAAIHSIFGNYDEAIKLLEKAFDDHSWSPQQVEHDPNFVSLVKTPGYQALLAKFKPLDLESTK